jgi:hypothetical protein
VGVIISTPVPCLGVNIAFLKSSTAGTIYAKVLPEPVFAAPRTSRPLMMCGIALA